MATTKAMPTAGIVVQMGDGASPEVFTEIAEVTSIDGPNEERTQIDVTPLSSTTKKFIGGVRDGGTVNISVNFSNDATLQSVRAAYIDGTEKNFKIKLTDHATSPTTAAFAGVVLSDGMKADVDQAVKKDYKIKISGDVTWTYAAGA